MDNLKIYDLKNTDDINKLIKDLRINYKIYLKNKNKNHPFILTDVKNSYHFKLKNHTNYRLIKYGIHKGGASYSYMKYESYYKTMELLNTIKYYSIPLNDDLKQLIGGFNNE